MEKIKLSRGPDFNNGFNMLARNRAVYVDDFVYILKDRGIKEICTTLVPFWPSPNTSIGFAIQAAAGYYLYFGLDQNKRLQCCLDRYSNMNMFNSKRNMVRQIQKYFDLDPKIRSCK